MVADGGFKTSMKNQFTMNSAAQEAFGMKDICSAKHFLVLIANAFETQQLDDYTQRLHDWSLFSSFTRISFLCIVGISF